MALVLADRVKDTTTSTGTGTITLANSPPAGFQSFTAVGDGNTTYYTIAGGSQWEVGIGTYTSSGTTLSRDTVLSSSSGGSLVDFAAGTKDVFVTYPAEESVYQDGAVIKAGTAILPVANGGTGITSFGTGIATFLGTPSSANLAAAVTDETGTGALVFATSPTLVTPVLGTPTSGTLSNCTVDGTTSVGFRTIPQNSQSANYTLVLDDSGRHIFHPVADNNARTFTIPANSSVAFPVGTAVTFINMAVASVTIAITTDTLTLSPAGTSGSRTLATNGSATCIKITSTQWLISGSGLT